MRFIQILLISPPLSYPLPLLSLTTHLALLTTHLPAPISTADEDPLFNDDWDAALPLYSGSYKPPVTLLVISVGDNIFFDPSASELSVADSVLAVSAARSEVGGLKVLGIRTVDSPARLSSAGEGMIEGGKGDEGVWRPPRGGMKRDVVKRMVKMVVEKGGVAEEVLDGLEGLDVG